MYSNLQQITTNYKMFLFTVNYNKIQEKPTQITIPVGL